MTGDQQYEIVARDEFIDEELKPGERVEVEISPRVWVPATVISDMETRVGVKLDTPVIIVEQTRIKTVQKPVGFLSWFKKTIETTTYDQKETYLTSTASGRWYVRRPKKCRS